MSKFSLTIETDGAAFDGDWRDETANILRWLADHLTTANATTHALMDIDGNRVGEWRHET